MADQSFQRRLAAILASDVVVYTQIMEENTDGASVSTMRQLFSCPTDRLGDLYEI